jgi:hypothetical protein
MGICSPGAARVFFFLLLLELLAAVGLAMEDLLLPALPLAARAMLQLQDETHTKSPV